MERSDWPGPGQVLAPGVGAVVKGAVRRGVCICLVFTAVKSGRLGMGEKCFLKGKLGCYYQEKEQWMLIK